MAEQFAVTHGALTKFSKTELERARQLRQIRKTLGADSPSETAFGSLPESEETGQDYRERVEETLTNLGFAAEQRDWIGEFIERTARSYQETEDHTSGEIRTIEAQARGTI
ncbi:hypothetical protein [Streptomyces meridianus]|uniref:Uncharacterized protein n=1 Tax=Streptomyces meridianus TaxID=2938945 RepID=A0ABT0X994_9ACTN|nr:hypothetical protein [Streptomyces meridianus]MCM2579097.1 hypothetical protein [Streptomyces meridianus]